MGITEDIINNPAKTIESVLSGPDVPDDNLSQSKYNFSYKAFPNDLGMDYNGHYMVININVPITKGTAKPRGELTNSQFGSTILPNEFSKVDILRFGKGVGANTSLPGEQREFASLGRDTRRIEESIALFMPNNMVYNTQNAYEDISLTALVAGIGSGILAGVTSKLPIPIVRSIGKLASGVTQVAGDVAKITGNPINPRVEILYATTPQRSFVFEILMMPRNQKEAETVAAIVKTLRFHAAPEIDPSGLGGSGALRGLFLIPPAEFDITFYNKGIENTKIPRINTCVLERIEVDYASTGVYATFEDGYPVATRLSLGFREIEIVHKRRVLQGF